MRGSVLGWVVSVAVLLPNLGRAQVFVQPTAYPRFTAANAAWQLRGDPVFHAGAFYYPAGPTVFFDGNVMMRTGTYEGVALYEDATITPFTIVYVPIGGNVVRPYERRREGELAGTVGSRTPSFPIQRDGEVSVAAGQSGTTGLITPPRYEGERLVIPESPGPTGTGGSILADVSAPEGVTPIRRIAPRGAVPTILQVWVPYAGARWYSAGAAVSYSPDRFVRIGDYRGFPVYRPVGGPADVIYIPSVADGPVAPYKKTP
jgi:hypothetical protein